MDQYNTLNEQNTKEDGQLQSKASLRALLEQLPLEKVCHAFAYGSGVFSQEGQHQPPRRGNRNDKDQNLDAAAAATAPTLALSSASSQQQQQLVDIIVVVSDARAFHEANYLLNPSHYPTGWWGWNHPNHHQKKNTSTSPAWATTLQCHVLWPNPFFCNPHVYFVLTDQGYKYGVVQINHILEDLIEWKYLYLAGRMHKPTISIFKEDNPAIVNAQQSYNLPNALVTALSILNEETTSSSSSSVTDVSDVDVFTTIASLSYMGDPRIGLFAEDPFKVQLLVQGHVHRWRNLYQPAIQRLQQRGLLSIRENNQWEWDRLGLYRCLPNAIAATAVASSSSSSNDKHNNNNINMKPIQERLRSIVAPSARYQSLKGLFTAHPQRSFSYAMRKLAKGLLFRRRPFQ